MTDYAAGKTLFRIHNYLVILWEPTRIWSKSDPEIDILLIHRLRQELVMWLTNVRLLSFSSRKCRWLSVIFVQFT